MEAVMLHRSPDQAISPYKSQIRNPRKVSHPFISRPCENFVPSSFQEMRILKAPPPLFSHSYAPFSLQQPPQPPLLPLPVTNPQCRTASRGISCPSTNKKTNNNNRTRDSSLTPKKSKSFSNSKKENKISTEKSSECVIISSTTPLGPDPKHLPKDVTKVLPFISSGNIIAHNCSVDTNTLSSLKAVVEDPSDKFSGSVVFAISPPPSSLPLPTFSMRPKLNCNAEAVGIDTGATDNLRRLLRLRFEDRKLANFAVLLDILLALQICYMAECKYNDLLTVPCTKINEETILVNQLSFPFDMALHWKLCVFQFSDPPCRDITDFLLSLFQFMDTDDDLKKNRQGKKGPIPIDPWKNT